MTGHTPASLPDYESHARSSLLVAVVNAVLVVGYCWMVVNL